LLDFITGDKNAMKYKNELVVMQKQEIARLREEVEELKAQLRSLINPAIKAPLITFSATKEDKVLSSKLAYVCTLTKSACECSSSECIYRERNDLADNPCEEAIGES
jgi:hypothetical protein